MGENRSESEVEAANEPAVGQQLSETTRIRAYEQVALVDPDATVYAFSRDGSGRGIVAPSALATLATARVDWRGDLVSDASRQDFEKAWQRALKHGGSRALLAPAGDAQKQTWWTLMDLRTELGCIAVVVGSQVPVASDADALVPRLCRWRSDAASVVIEVDDATGPMMGYPDGYMLGKTALHFLHPDDHESSTAHWIEMLSAPDTSMRSVVRYRRASGEYFWAEVTNHNRLHDLGWIEREILDVSEQMEAVLAANDKDRVLSGIADVLPNGIAQFDAKLRQVFSNDRWKEITGFADTGDRNEYAALVVEPSALEVVRQMRRALAESGSYDSEISIVSSGSPVKRRCRLAVRSLVGDDGERTGFVASIDDITASWRLQQRLVEQATRDRLTGLANRTAVLDHLDAALDRAKATARATAAIFVDLNEFKRVNDVLGHAAGDGLLREIATNIVRAVRPDDLVARHGGDEFLVVCEDVAGPDAALEIARRILNNVAGRYLVEGQMLEASAACGVAIDVGGVHTAERMIAEADLAMYERKRSGNHEPGLFVPTMFEEQREELNRDGALAQASEDDSLVLHYQPIVNLQSLEVVAYEALLRWNFEGELVYPDQFIGLAERRGLISKIGEWVLDQVCRKASEDGRPDIVWGLNVSPIQLRDGAFDTAVATALDRYGFPADRLALELTEGVLMAKDAPTSALMHRLSEMGVRLIVDDFGTGYASLDYLRNYAVAGVKIDRGFTADLHRERTLTIVRSVAAMAEMLDVRLVVEGIETQEQAGLARSTGATMGQGYLFGRPGPIPVRESTLTA